jgi:hypothetical protein
LVPPHEAFAIVAIEEKPMKRLLIRNPNGRNLPLFQSETSLEEDIRRGYRESLNLKGSSFWIRFEDFV